MMPFIETHFSGLQMVSEEQALKWAVHIFANANGMSVSDRIRFINQRLTGCEFTEEELSDELSRIRRETNRNSIEYISARAKHNETAC